MLPPGADLAKGHIVFALVAMMGFLEFATPGGVSVKLEPVAGEGPFYLRGGVLRPGATFTEKPELLTSALDAQLAVFTNLGENEYTIHVSDNAPSSVGLFGYRDERIGAIPTPVLDRHWTLVTAFGQCRDPTDPLDCAAKPVDAGGE